MGEQKIRVSVVMPALNEAATIGSVVMGTHRALQDLGVPYEVIVVDNGSTDRTVEVAFRCNARLILNGRDLGKGSSIVRGVHHARGSVVATIDTDGENQPREIPRLVNSIVNENADLVIGSRFSGNIEHSPTSGVRILGNKIINLLILLLTGIRLTDSQSGFRAFKRSMFVGLNLESKGYEIEAEMTVRALKKGFAVKEVAVACDKRFSGSSRLSTLKDGFRILKTILKVFFGR